MSREWLGQLLAWVFVFAFPYLLHESASANTMAKFVGDESYEGSRTSQTVRMQRWAQQHALTPSASSHRPSLFAMTRP